MSPPGNALPVGVVKQLQVRAGHPDFLDAPWQLPLSQWKDHWTKVVEVPRGLSRHEVVFAAYPEAIYAFKELPTPVGEKEYDLLCALETRGLPSVVAAGHVRVRLEQQEAPERSVLITRFLEGSLPFRMLFMQPGLLRYRERLLDAMAGLLVRLHLNGFYWGDCSLSNTLFKRDAGELQAYLVDAETSASYVRLMDGQRAQDLMILEENITGDLADLAAVTALPDVLDVASTGKSIRQRYERLWEEATKVEAIAPGEQYRIQERIRALNALGFTVREVELVSAVDGNHVRMRPVVTDRDYHRHELHNLTGIVAEERQSMLMLNEVRELQTALAVQHGRSTPLSVAAFTWLNQRFHPTVSRLMDLLPRDEDGLAELYCQVLEHKWFLSEKAQADVGLERALVDYLRAIKGVPAEAAPSAGSPNPTEE